MGASQEFKIENNTTEEDTLTAVKDESKPEQNPVPQPAEKVEIDLTRYGVKNDYMNMIAPLYQLYYDKGIKKNKNEYDMMTLLKERQWRMDTYSERYPRDANPHLYTEGNEATIKRIDEIASLINDNIREGGYLSEEDFKKIYNELAGYLSLSDSPKLLE